MSRPTRRSYRQIASRSSLVTPSPYYIGWWPMNQLIDDGAGGRTYNKIAFTNSGTTVDVTNNVFIHADIETARDTWLTPGLPIKKAHTGTPPSPTLSTVIYYAGFDAGNPSWLPFHLTEADALADTNRVDLTTTGSGGSTSTIYPAIVYDHSGQGNDLTFGANLSNVVAFGDIGTRAYMASGSSGTLPVYLGAVPAATFNARWNWPHYSLLVITSLMATGTFNEDRSIFAQGSPTSDGPKIQYSSSSFPGKWLMGMRHGGGGASQASTQRSATVLDEDVPHNMAVLFDANAMFIHAWLDGHMERSLQYEVPSGLATLSVNGSNDFVIGGSGNANQAFGFSDTHLLSIPASVSFHLPTLTDMMMGISSGPYYRLRDGDL